MREQQCGQARVIDSVWLTWRLLLCVGTVAGCWHPQATRPTAALAPAVVAEGRFIIPYQGSDRPRDEPLEYGRFAIPITIHGRTLQAMADHGANAFLLSDAAIELLRIPHGYSGAARADTLAPRAGRQPDSTAELTLTRRDTIFQYWDLPEPRPLDSLRIGTSRQDSVLLAFELAADVLEPFEGVIGRDMLSQFDLLFDMPAGILRLYQRESGAPTGHPPRWLPDGLSRRDCQQARVLRHTMDTTGFGEEGKHELSRNPAKRFWEQEEIQLPIVVNGRSINGTFDSGAGGTVMNWAAARTFGITRASPSVTAYMSGGMRAFTINAAKPRVRMDSSSAGDADSTFAFTGLAIRMGDQQLAADTVFISDPHFADFPNYETEPMVFVGLRQIRDHKLFLSYSTGFVCLARATQVDQRSR